MHIYFQMQPFFKDIIPIVKHHHERFDGHGYPGKLKGEEIPYLARIATVADSFDAMTSKRSYRDSLPIDVVKEEIKKRILVHNLTQKLQKFS